MTPTALPTGTVNVAQLNALRALKLVTRLAAHPIPDPALERAVTRRAARILREHRRTA